MVKAISTPNIAFIKYWGNRPRSTSLGTTTGHGNVELRLPAADSLSMTLDSPTVGVTIEPANVFTVNSEKELSQKEIERFRQHLDLTNKYLSFLHYKLLTTNYSLIIRSHIPPAIGLASSAAVFSAVAKAYAELLIEKGTQLTDEQISVIARLGSGSAARSVMGGFVALKQWCHSERSRRATLGHGSSLDYARDDTELNMTPDLLSNHIDSAFAIQIAPASHWPLHDIVVCPSMKEKEHGSTEGHHLAHTSPHFADRLREIPRRQQECINAILQKDFEKLQSVAEEDALDLHKIAETSTPLLHYLNTETHRIINEVTELRNREHLAVLYTMDAGPTVHLVCTEDAVKSVKQFAHFQKGCTVFETKIGNGARTMATTAA